MASQMLLLILKELEDIKSHLQESLQLFRKARQNLKFVNPRENEFVFRRLIQLERDALRNFERDIRRMNESVEKRVKPVLMNVASAQDEEAIAKIRRELRHLQNAFDAESPALSAALAQVESRVSRSPQPEDH